MSKIRDLKLAILSWKPRGDDLTTEVSILLFFAHLQEYFL